jgi:hypothetical protein
MFLVYHHPDDLSRTLPVVLSCTRTSAFSTVSRSHLQTAHLPALISNLLTSHSTLAAPTDLPSCLQSLSIRSGRAFSWAAAYLDQKERSGAASRTDLTLSEATRSEDRELGSRKSASFSTSSGGRSSGAILEEALTPAAGLHAKSSAGRSPTGPPRSSSSSSQCLRGTMPKYLDMLVVLLLALTTSQFICQF